MMAGGTRLCHFDEAVLLGGAVEFEQGFEQRAHLRQRPRVGTVAERFFRLRMGFHEKTGYAHRDRRARQHRDELALAAAAAALPARQLYRVGGVEHHRAAGVAHYRQRAHVADQVVVAEAGARSEEHTSELQSLMRISYAVFCLKKKK